MRRRTCLERLNRSFAGRITQLQFIANKIAGKRGDDVDCALAFVTIEAQTAWVGFAREFYLSCAFLHPKTIAGQRVSHHNPSIIDEYRALLYSISALKGKVWAASRIPPQAEPVWHEKRALPLLSGGLALSNNASIISGFSYRTTFFDELPTMRNFYAHRSYGTAMKVFGIAARKYGAAKVLHPNDLVNVVFAGRVQT